MSKIEVDAIDKQSGSTLTIGGSGTTVQLGTGASQTGFGREGSVNWQTGSIKTTTFTAVSGEGYFVDTSSGGVTVNLPAGSAGAIVAFADYTRTFNTNNLTIAPNGSNKIGGVSQSAKLSVNGQSATFVFVDATEGWINVQETQTSVIGTSPFIVASGGTETESGNFKIHTFTGPGTFTVTGAGVPGLPAPTSSTTVDYLVIGGGGGGAGGTAFNCGSVGGGGAGGYRESSGAASGCYARSPLGACVSALPVSVQAYPITVGAGAAAQTCTGPNCAQKGIRGSDSTFSTITSAAGGGGKADTTPSPLSPGGSGGGGNYQNSPGGSGNTPPVSPPQGNNGGAGSPSGPPYASGGGGGAGAVGGVYAPGASGAGGAGVASSITASPVTRAGGGGGGGSDSISPGSGGSGGGGAGGGPSALAGDGTANTGGGGGAANSNPHPAPGTTTGAGGSGIVVIRYRFQ
jgi:hypothetical protein